MENANNMKYKCLVKDENGDVITENSFNDPERVEKWKSTCRNATIEVHTLDEGGYKLTDIDHKGSEEFLSD